VPNRTGIELPEANAVPLSLRKQFKNGNATETAPPPNMPRNTRRLLRSAICVLLLIQSLVTAIHSDSKAAGLDKVGGLFAACFTSGDDDTPLVTRGYANPRAIVRIKSGTL
jgi:hypothetical protein